MRRADAEARLERTLFIDRFTERMRPDETRAMVAEEMASGDYDATAYVERGETLDAARARVLEGLLRRAEVT